MTTDNALDPAPVRRRTGRAPYRRIAAIVAGVAIAVVVVLVIVHMVFKPPNQQDAARAAFARGGGGSQAQVTPPPAVTPASAAQANANLQALQKAANSPALAATPVQVSTVSPPAGPAPKGDGVTASAASVGPADS
jgi:hypothetical protein